MSLVAHLFLAWVLGHWASHNETLLKEKPIEVTINEPLTSKKQKSFAKEIDPLKESLKEVNDKADFFSKTTKRFKEQTRARVSGQTQNRTGDLPLDSDEKRSHGNVGSGVDKKMTQYLQLPLGEGPKVEEKNGSGRFGQQVVVGSSTVGEHIPGIKEGAFTALNTDQYTYYTFFARINEQTRARWVNNLRQLSNMLPQSTLVELSKQERTTQVDIQINGKGDFVRAVVLHSSGFKELDQAAINAFKEAAPFQNPPQEMLERDNLIHLQYGFYIIWQPLRGDF